MEKVVVKRIDIKICQLNFKLMKKTLLIFCCLLVLNLLLSGNCLSQVNSRFEETNSLDTTLIDIHYYHDSINQQDEYVKSICTLDLYYPKNKKEFATIVWIHGGGLKYGKKEIPERLKNQGMAIVAINYRLYPKVSSPGYIEDAAAAVAWVFNNIEEYGGSSDKIYVAGSSAGAYLAAMIGLDKKWLAVHELDANKILGLGLLGGQMFTHFTVREERGIGKTTVVVDDLAPISHLRDDVPPIFMVTGDREMEMLGRYEENAIMYRMLKVVGQKDIELLELGGYGHAPKEPFFPLLLKEVKKELWRAK